MGPKLRPEIGFCVETNVTGTQCTGKLYINLTSHILCGMPQSHSGQPVTKDFVLKRGLNSTHVPLDCGSFRRLKVRATGAKESAWAVDVVLHPFLIKLFSDDSFNKHITSPFRGHLLDIAINHLEEAICPRKSVKIHRGPTVKLVMDTFYKDPDDGEAQELKEIIPIGADSDDEDSETEKENGRRRAAAKKKEEESKIQEVKKQTPLVKKGFFNNAKTELYPEGSGEGVLPENAGDPMGWMPKSLRQKCNIVDCNSEEYKNMEEQNQKAAAVKKHNDEAQNWNNELNSNLDRWTKKSMDAQRWKEDNPIEEKDKYSIDYSRFNFPDSDDEEQPHKNIKPPLKPSNPPEAVPVPKVEKEKPKPAPAPKKKIDPKNFSQADLDKLIETAPAGTQDEIKQLMKQMEGDDFGQNLGSDLNVMNKFAEAALGKDYAEKANKDIQKTKKVDLGKLDNFGDGVGNMKGFIEKDAEKRAAMTKPKTTRHVEPNGNIRCEIETPGLLSMRGVDLEVTDELCKISFPIDLSNVEIPWKVDSNTVKAKFSKKTQTLTITAEPPTID